MTTTEQRETIPLTCDEQEFRQWMDLSYPIPPPLPYRWQCKPGMPKTQQIIINENLLIYFMYKCEGGKHRFSFEFLKGSSNEFEMFLDAVRAKFAQTEKATHDLQGSGQPAQELKGPNPKINNTKNPRGRPLGKTNLTLTVIEKINNGENPDKVCDYWMREYIGENQKHLDDPIPSFNRLLCRNGIKGIKATNKR